MKHDIVMVLPLFSPDSEGECPITLEEVGMIVRDRYDSLDEQIKNRYGDSCAGWLAEYYQVLPDDENADISYIEIGFTHQRDPEKNLTIQFNDWNVMRVASHGENIQEIDVLTLLHGVRHQITHFISNDFAVFKNPQIDLFNMEDPQSVLEKNHRTLVSPDAMASPDLVC